MNRRRVIAVALAALAGLLVACSGGDDDGPGRDLSAEEKARLEEETEFAQCLREQGFEDYPDPQVSEGGYLLSGSPMRPDDAWQAAQEACSDAGAGDGAEPEADADAGADADAAAAGWARVVPGGDVQSGRLDPAIVLARPDYAYDEPQSDAFSYFDVPASDLLSLMDGNEASVEAAGVPLRSYVAPGEGHTVPSDEAFYAATVNERPLVHWVARLVGGEPVEDVDCTDCTAV